MKAINTSRIRIRIVQMIIENQQEMVPWDALSDIDGKLEYIPSSSLKFFLANNYNMELIKS